MSVINSQTGDRMISQEMAGLLLCIEGNANLLINGAEHKFSRGSLCIISPFLFVEIVSASDNCKWETICDDKDVFLSLAICVFDAIKENNLPNNTCRKLDEKQIEEFMFFVDKINEKQRMLGSKSEKEDSTLLRQNITLLKQIAAMEFITLHFQEQHLLSHKGSRNENVAYNFINSLNQNYSIHRDVGWYAEQANLSTIYFTKIIRKYTGYTPNVMIRHITIAYAKMMLSQSELSIKEIAAKLNFSSQLTFSRYFKSCTKMSPKEYRETGGMCC